jgi:hypothetical protein
LLLPKAVAGTAYDKKNGFGFWGLVLMLACRYPATGAGRQGCAHVAGCGGCLRLGWFARSVGGMIGRWYSRVVKTYNLLPESIIWIIILHHRSNQIINRLRAHALCRGQYPQPRALRAHTALSVQPTDGSSGLDFGLFVSFRSDGYGFKFIFAPTG